jgi:peptidoglycan hydrolase-like protein with peptidoglycan-binding domain
MRWLLFAMLCAVMVVPPAVAVASPAPRARRHHRRRHHRRRYQSHPSHARYKQIQQALADKGFLPQDGVDGFWGPNSIDAMKRFQAAQKLPSDGDIDALTLIALGLGPRHKSSMPVTTAASTKKSSSADAEADAQPQQN